jgi:putative transposase
MHFEPGEFYHVYNRGNNRQPIFFNERNYLFFLKKVREQLLPFSDIIAYCLMPNHFHFLIRANENGLKERNSFGGKSMQELAYRIGILLSSYSQAINKQNKTTGSLFQQKTKAKILSEINSGSRLSYFEQCFHYIHQNPVIARLVKKIADWPYSSYLDYAGLRNGALCKKEIFSSLTGLTSGDIIEKTMMELDEKILNKIF